ncbi:MAG TPA: hypothetical protein PLE30_02935, partial [Candidatus Kapabacteria bacterium]|nr:hypothetical protein [Candidatus Kapabacteria bacterium]
NTWTADQYLPATNAQGNNLVAAANMANAQSLNGDVVNYDATLQVTANELGFDLTHQNTWLTTQSFMPASDEPAVIIDGTASVNNPTLMAVSNNTDANLDFVFSGDMQLDGSLDVFEDLGVSGATTTNTLSVTLDASVGTDLSVGNNLDVTNATTTGSLTVNNDAVVDGNFEANGNVILGSANTDNVTFNGVVNSDIIPDLDNTRSLGSSLFRWNDLYLGPGTLHIGSDGDEGHLSYDILNDEFDFDQSINVTGNGTFSGDVDVTGTVTAGTLNGGYGDGALLFADAAGNIADNATNLSWDNATHTLSLDGNILIAGGSADPEIWVNGGQGVRVDGGATLTIENYSFPVITDAPTKFLALNAAADSLVWWTYDNTIAVDTTNHIIGLNQNAPFTFTNIVAFNPASGSAINATSSDPSAPTVVIEHTSPTGVALQLTGAEAQTTALEITTGSVNVANGQLIVSSNTGTTGAEPNGPSLILNNNGDGGTENGAALLITMGHAAFAYNSYAPAAGDPIDLSNEAYTVLDITSDGTNAVTLPSANVNAENYGTIIYIINSGTGTLTLGALGNVNTGASAQLVYTAAGWFRLN